MKLSKRILALLLCLVMFVSLLPVTANAEQAAYHDVAGNFHFYSYAQLKQEMKNKASQDSLRAIYEGSGALTIKESVTLPAKPKLRLKAQEVIIDKGATVTLTGESFSAYDIAKVTVNGKLVNNSGLYGPNSTIVVNGSLESNNSLKCNTLTIKGSVKNGDWFFVKNLSGRDKLQNTSGVDSYVFLQWEVSTVAALESAIKEAAAETDTAFNYEFYTTSMTLSKSLTIPERSSIVIENSTFTLAKGATLTVEGAISALNKNAKLSVKGTLANKSVINASSGAVIALESGGTYKDSDGRIWLTLPKNDSGKYVGKPEDYLPGFKLEDFDCTDRGNGSYTYHLKSQATLNGWVKQGGDWYYYKNGKMVTNAWAKDSKGWCYLGTDGRMVTNAWKKDSKGWCYLKADGRMAISQWVQDGGKWYYMNASGYMVTGWQKVGGTWYHFKSGGAMTANAWAKDSKGWCYLGADGKMVTNTWKKDSKGWCYLGSDGRMAISQWIKDNGKWYYLDGSGYMTTGWLKDNGKWYYLDSSGVMVTGTRTINGKSYTFNSSGVCQNP